MRLVQDASTVRTTSYDAANQLKTSKSAVGTTTYTFDANGNLQVVREPRRNRTTYTWHYENQNTLVRLLDGSGVTMACSPNFRLTRKDPQ